jgi:hypothetical protein
MPNHMCPPMGYVPKLRQREFILPTIHTFGFGYSLIPGLLKSIAEIGGGNYGFIPDSGMLGTVIIHAIANLQSTFANHAVLRLRYPAAITVDETATSGSVDRRDPVTAEESGMTELNIPLGNLQFGQSRDVYLAIRPTDATKEHLPRDCVIDAVLDYQRMTDELYTVAASCSPTNTSSSSLSSDEIAFHISRSEICKFISNLYPTDAHDQHTCCSASVATDASLVTHFIDSLPVHSFKSSLDCEALLSDIRHDSEPQGQLAMALSTQDVFDKWGCLYLPSLQCAHEKQLCNSFKDPGPQVYGQKSSLFKQCRDRLDNAFDNLKPPPPTRCSRHRRKGGAPPRPLANMRAWRNVSGGCFLGSTQVSLYESASRAFEDLRRGDVVLTIGGQGRRVAAVVRMRVIECEILEIQGVAVTPWHPISRAGQDWIFPAHILNAGKRRFTGYVYSAMLEQDDEEDGKGMHTVEVGGPGSGIWGVTLGHGIVTGSDLRAHTYFGDYATIKDSLSRLEVIEDGVFACGGVIRGLDGRICGFARDEFVGK